jgi:hypothetical protein
MASFPTCFVILVFTFSKWNDKFVYFSICHIHTHIQTHHINHNRAIYGEENR